MNQYTKKWKYPHDYNAVKANVAYPFCIRLHHHLKKKIGQYVLARYQDIYFVKN